MKQNYQYLFGPVPSRRLGVSLGIDMVPFKICTLDCIYCECGKTTQCTTKLDEYSPANEIISEIDHFMATNIHIDALTFTGSGEPTLNSELGTVISHIAKSYPNVRKCLLTNSTLFFDKTVQKAAQYFDLILPSIDAVSQDVMEKINRPHKDIRASKLIDSLLEFTKIYKGIIWIEVFISPGINDSENELGKIKHVLKLLKPKRVQLNTLDRPSAYTEVCQATAKQMQEIAEFLKPLPVEIISRASLPKFENSKGISFDMIYKALRRRPLTIEDISVTLGKSINEVTLLLKPHIDSKKIIAEKNGQEQFYRI